MSAFLYSNEHIWVLRENDTVRIGISRFAKEDLGEIVYIELPPAGTTVTAGDAISTIDSLKSSSELYAPVSGTVVQVNDALLSDKSLEAINSDPQGAGWVLVLAMSDPGELEKLMNEHAYHDFIEE